MHIISVLEKTLDFADNEFEWDAMRGLLDYYSDVRDGGNGKVLLLAETGRKLQRERSGDKSGLSILGGGAIRNLVPMRSKPALILLQQEGTKDLGWSGHQFWWPILAAPGTVEPWFLPPKSHRISLATEGSSVYAQLGPLWRTQGHSGARPELGGRNWPGFGQ